MSKRLWILACTLVLTACFGPDKFTDEQMFSVEGTKLWKDLSSGERIKALRGTLAEEGKEVPSDEHLDALEKCMDKIIEEDTSGRATIGGAMGACSLQNAIQGIGAGLMKSLGRGE